MRHIKNATNVACCDLSDDILQYEAFQKYLSFWLFLPPISASLPPSSGHGNFKCILGIVVSCVDSSFITSLFSGSESKEPVTFFYLPSAAFYFLFTSKSLTLKPLIKNIDSNNNNKMRICSIYSLRNYLHFCLTECLAFQSRTNG